MKRVATIVISIILTGICFISRAQEIRDIETVVSLYKDGSALVVQKWDITVVKGTERYIPIDNLGKSYIHDFRVFENGEEYASDGRSWNSDRSAQEKAGRCGIIDKKGGNIELCWGQGSLGDHVYTISYIIDNLVLDYGDCDGFHWHFLNDEWQDKPQHVSLRIINETGGDAWFWNNQDDNNVRVWAFGMVGNVWVEDGALVFESTEPFKYQSFLSAMVRFEKGLFEPAEKGDGSFESLRDKAFEGSDYDDDDSADFEEILFRIIFIIIFVIPAMLILLTIIYLIILRIYWRITGRKYVKKIFGRTKIDGWSRDVPFGGNPTALFSLLISGDNLSKDRKKLFPNLVSAYFLKWIQEGLLSVERDLDNFEKMNLRFVKGDTEIAFEDSMEGTIYNAALKAAGENLLLEANEFKNWSYKHDTTVTKWPDEAVSSAKPLWETATEEERCKAVEFKNYLNDFTILDQREAPEVNTWKQYMVLAASLGIAEKVARNFEKLFPQMMEEYANQTHMTNMPTTYVLLKDIGKASDAMMASALRRQAERQAAEARANRSSGGGGSISFGGGGGGFGGGHGGGSR